MTSMTRRQVLKTSAAMLGASIAPSLLAAAKEQGFKIGGVDWELKGANDAEAIAVAARLGFDGLQVDLGDVEPMRNESRQKMFQDKAREHNIEIASLALGALGGISYFREARAVPLVYRAIEVAAAMRQKVLLLAFFGRSDLPKKKEDLDAVVARLKEHGAAAEKAGVILGVETECTAAQYRDLIERVGSPAVQVYFDVVHAHVGGGPIDQEIASMKGHICEFHAKDYGNILFGQGKIDFAAVRRGMDAIGYRGWIQIEQWAEVKGEKPLGFDETHKRNLQYLREIFPREM